MEAKEERTINKLVDSGFPEDLIKRYIKACKKNYVADNEIISRLEDQDMPSEVKVNKKLSDLWINSFRDATAIEEALEVYPKMPDLQN